MGLQTRVAVSALQWALGCELRAGTVDLSLLYSGSGV